MLMLSNYNIKSLNFKDIFAILCKLAAPFSFPLLFEKIRYKSRRHASEKLFLQTTYLSTFEHN